MISTGTPESWRPAPPVEMLAATWLAGYPCPRTRRTYQTMVRSWLDWRAQCGVEPLAARRAHVELRQRGLEQHGYAARTIALKLTAVARFFRDCQQEDVLTHTPMACVRRPRVERLSPRGHSAAATSTTCSPPPNATASIPTDCAACSPSTDCASAKRPASTSTTWTTTASTPCSPSPAKAAERRAPCWRAPPKPPSAPASPTAAVGRCSSSGPAAASTSAPPNGSSTTPAPGCTAASSVSPPRATAQLDHIGHRRRCRPRPDPTCRLG